MTADFSASPVLVWQMGKVGSMSIQDALVRAGIESLHVHVLAPARLNERRMLRLQAKLPPTQQHEDGLRLQPLLADPTIGFRVVSAVRDPIAQALSVVFQRWDEVAPPGVDPNDPAAIARWFIRDVPHFEHLRWFENEVEHLFGEDVYSVPFDKERGCLQIEGRRLKLLVLRCEDGNARKEEALGTFFGRPDIHLRNVNAAADKPIAELYRNTRRCLKLPPELLDGYLDSRLVRHFYSDAEIAAFRTLWGG